MKIQYHKVLIYLTQSLMVLQFSLCAPPTKPEFPPHLRNGKNLRIEGTPKPGEKFIMHIEAVSNNPLTYKWYKNSVLIKGAENDSFVIDALKSEDEGVYKCEVFALSASVFSNPYELKIKRDNKELLLKNNGTVFSSGVPQLNKSFFLYIKPVNNLPLTFQWYKNLKLIKQATKDTLPFWQISNKDQGNFHCEVKHNSEKERSLPYLLKIGNDSPRWSNDTMWVKIDAGALLKLSLKDSCNDGNNDPLSFILMNGKPDNDLINNGIYEFKSNPWDMGEYEVRISASDGNVTSIGVIKIMINKWDIPPEFRDSLPYDSYQLIEGGNLTIKFEAVDGNNDNVTYRLSENTLPRPETVVFDTKSKKLLWVSKQGDKGIYTVVIEASDGESATKKRVDIGIGNVNLPPRISILNVEQGDTVHVTEEETIQFTAKLSDPNRVDKPTFKKPKNLPKSASFDELTGIFTYTPDYGVSSESLNTTFPAIMLHATDNVSENPLQAKFVFHITVLDKKFLITALSKTGGTIDPSGIIKVDPGKYYTFTITPNIYWKTKGVLVNGKDKGAIGSYTFSNIGQDNTIEALFEKKTYTVTISSDGNGKADPEGMIRMESNNSKVIIIIKANDDYRFYKWDILQGNPEIRRISIDTFEVLFTDESTAIKALFSKKYSLKAFDAGTWNTHFLKSDNTLWAVGDNRYGQLGIGEEEDSKNFAVQVLTDVDSVISGRNSTFVIRNDKTLWATGLNDDGQLGLGDTLNRISFTQIPGFINIKGITVGEEHTLIIKADGTLWGAGSNDECCLGLDGDGQKRLRFTRIPEMNKIIKVCAGWDHSIVLRSDNTIWGVGRNWEGQLGLGDWKQRNRFTQMPGIGEIADIAAGSYTTHIIKKDNSLWAIGDDVEIKSDGTLKNRWTPIHVMNDVKSISYKLYHFLILKIDNTLWSMGRNSSGELGNGPSKTIITRPIKITDNVIYAITGSYHSLILKNDSTVWGTGSNSYGELGLGDRDDRYFFTQIPYFAWKSYYLK